MNTPKTIFCDLDGTLVKHPGDVSLLTSPEYELELLPGVKSRQEEINKFFREYQRLKGPKPGEQGLPAWDDDYNTDGIPDHWNNPEDDDTYTQRHDITYFTEEDDGFIPRLNEDIPANNVNENQTLQFLRDDLNEYLKDIDTPLVSDSADERPEWPHISDGYLKIRNLNQAIIIRSQESVDTGIIGADAENPSYLNDGFTITMWVRFLDRVSTGTLFNYGNPTRPNNLNPLGFMLETISVHEDDFGDNDIFTTGITPNEAGFFQDNSYERFIRLYI